MRERATSVQDSSAETGAVGPSGQVTATWVLLGVGFSDGGVVSGSPRSPPADVEPCVFSQLTLLDDFCPSPAELEEVESISQV